MTDLSTLTLRVVLLGACLALANCAKPSNLTPLPPSVCAPIEAEPLIQGGLVEAVTPEEIEAQSAFLQSIAGILDWGRAGWRRAETAKQACE